MVILAMGLVLFLGVHSVRVFADAWRTAMVERLGAGPWKGLYSLVAVIGFGLIVWGWGVARQNPVVLWAAPPVAVKHVASLLTLVAFVLLVATYVPRNAVKARLRHPMILGVKAWALAHLIANNTLADLLLFGSFLAWAVLDYASAKRRDRAAGTGVSASASAMATVLTVLVGIGLWAGFAFWAHGAWIGVRPLGR